LSIKLPKYVLCVDNSSSPLKKGEIYEVEGENTPADFKLKNVISSRRKNRFIPLKEKRIPNLYRLLCE
jgi:hypothetical protein